MGQNNVSENNLIFQQITDFAKIDHPKTYVMVKMASFNVKLSNKITIDNDIKSIVDYLFTSHLNKNIDILCLQGISSNTLAIKLVSKIKSELKKTNKTKEFYFAPSFDDIENRNSSTFFAFIENIEIQNKRVTTKIENQNKMKAITQNIIISAYPIIDWYFSDLDYDHDADDVYGIKSLVCANIKIANKIVSIYNTELSNNIISAGVINEDLRKLELDALNYEIKRNKFELKNNKNYSTIKKSEIHIIAGTLNINEIEKNTVNEEFIDVVKKLKVFDIFRFLNPFDIGYTTKNKKERNSFIMLILDDEFLKLSYTKTSVIELIHKFYGLLFIKIGIYKIPTHLNKQIEAVFILRK